MTAKFKVGDEVTVPNGRRGRVVQVTTAYTLQFHDADSRSGLPWYDNELERYDPPLAVGDRVRVKGDWASGGVIRHIEGEDVCYWSKVEGVGLKVQYIDDLERDPDAGKAGA